LRFLARKLAALVANFWPAMGQSNGMRSVPMDNDLPRVLLYRERNTTQWIQVRHISAVQFGIGVRGGTRASLTCHNFARLRGGALPCEFVILELHELDTDIRFAPNVALEYRKDPFSEAFSVTAQISLCAYPEIPVEYSSAVSLERGVVRYRARRGLESEFLSIITNSSLIVNLDQLLSEDTLEQPVALGFSLGRATPPAVRPVSPPFNPPKSGS
jgi:hypothetical protein